MYTNFMSSNRECDGESNLFFIKIRLHRETALSLYIFTLVMNEIKEKIQRNVPS
jgi:hypothetical protein